MRKLLILAGLILCQQFIVEAQRLGLKGGLDILGANYHYNDQQEDSRPQMGFHLGMAIEFNLSESIALGSGVIFSEKGFQEDYQLPGEDKTTFFYIEIPILFIYKIPVGKNHLYIHAGPYLGWGLFTNLTGANFEMEDGFGEDPHQYQKYDFGLVLGGGIEFDSWRFGLGGNIGLVDIRNAADTRITNRVIGLDIAYMFGQK